MVLDLKMPRLTGFDVLDWLHSHPQYRDLPVVVLSSSDNPIDITRARELGDSDYYVKPISYHHLISIAKELQTRWLTPGVSPQPQQPGLR